MAPQTLIKYLTGTWERKLGEKGMKRPLDKKDHLKFSSLMGKFEQVCFFRLQILLDLQTVSLLPRKLNINNI